MARRSPIGSGVALALAAALSFGVTTPIVAQSGHGVGAFWTAALLYAGACLSAFALGRFSVSKGAPLRPAHLWRLVAVAVFGAGLAPTLLAWGLQRVGGTTGSLLLNLEAVFTVAFARLVYQEHIGHRVLVALGLMTLGGAVLTLGAASSTGWNALGALAIVGATAAWALDNTLTRQFSAQDPLQVIAGKGALGVVLTSAAALLFQEPTPGARQAVVLLACGATGYGLSLRLYLLAQRRMGAARTGSTFALAPFIGAVLAWVIGDRSIGAWALPAAILLIAGVALHITERHRHRHAHAATMHEHPHRRDDEHHDHLHDPPVVGEHSHVHDHGDVEHEHEHAPDAHHDHVHA